MGIKRLLFATLLAFACSGEERFELQKNGQGENPQNCFSDISDCDITGNYILAGADIPPLFFSTQFPISQAKDVPTGVVLAPYLTFYLGTGTYFFRSVGDGTWDGDSLKSTIHGKLRNANLTGYPVVGGFSITLKLDAKQKTFTNANYYMQLARLTLPALDGIMVVSDTAHVVFPVTNTNAKVLLTQF